MSTTTAITAALFIYGTAFIVSMGVAGMISVIYWTVRWASTRKNLRK